MARMLISSICFFLLLWANGVAAAAVADSTNSFKKNAKPELTNLRSSYIKNDVTTGGAKLRLVVDSSGPVKAVGRLENKNGLQLVIDITGAASANIEAKTALKGDVAEQVYAKRLDENTLRLEVDLAEAIEAKDYRVFTLQPDLKNDKPFRVVVDINKAKPKQNYRFTAGLKNKVIALDPGHGGSDPGSIGQRGTKEKELTLAVALRVKGLLEKSGARVVMTRQNDRDVFGPNASAVDELQARTNIANRAKSDVFVSIHINSFQDRSVGGTSSYYYPKSAYDLMLARTVQAGMLKAGSVDDRGVNSARFYVVQHALMPAVLTELAFISNPEEEKMLKTASFQQKMAEGIVEGLGVFFNQAAQKGGGVR